jgi:hypothetical protein
MSIRAEIAKEVVDNETVVEHEGKRYLVRGRTDAEVITSSMLRAGEKRNKSIHWGRVVGAEFNDESVKNVLIVQKTLVPCTWDADKQEWVPEDAYDETEIAELCKKNGPLFLKLLAAAYGVIGVKEDEPIVAGRVVEQAAGKNSEKPTE